VNDLRFRLCYMVLAILGVFVLEGCESSYKKAGRGQVVKRYCWMADLKDDEGLIEEYKEEMESELWKGICETMKEKGVLGYEIYQIQNRLLMIVETVLDFDVVEFGREIGERDDVKKWAGRMDRYFQTIEGFEDYGWWILLGRVYKLEQKREYDKSDGYIVRRATVPIRRICDARELVDELAKISKYKELHAMGKAWPEITQSMIDAGMIDLEIYLAGNRTFEITEVPADADIEEIWTKVDNGPRSSEWGALMRPLDVPFTDEAGRPLDNQLMERIFKLN
jgi:L-rhamnose mutarotase